MNFLKKFFGQDNTIIGLSGIRKRNEYIKINIPNNYKKTLLTDISTNYLLI